MNATPIRRWSTYANYARASLLLLLLVPTLVWLGRGNVAGYAVLLISLLLFAQSLFSLYLMLYTWDHPERLEASRGPSDFAPPQLSFTVLLPARHAWAVIYRTIHHAWAVNYPRELLEIVVICHADDHGTIAEARRAIAAIGSKRLRVETFDDALINKPHGLNVGLRTTRNAVVTIFDAEDDIDAEILNVTNTVMMREQVGIVQAGVQLMNYRDHWFSIHNCLEYFFWFKSRLHYHAHHGMVPLGGNTVFIRRKLLEQAGGWDETCLTEDAEIGIRLSVLGKRVRVVCDPQRVTREETPDTIAQFIKQRTRWHQGFIQVFRKGAWRGLPRLDQRLLAIYTLTYPLFQAMLFLLWPAMLIAVLWLKLPVSVALISFLPLYAFVLQLFVSVVGAYLFCREYAMRFTPLLAVQMTLTFIPYQLMMSVSAVRAIMREALRQNNWEKTAHSGAHRQGEADQGSLVLQIEQARAIGMLVSPADAQKAPMGVRRER